MAHDCWQQLQEPAWVVSQARCKTGGNTSDQLVSKACQVPLHTYCLPAQLPAHLTVRPPTHSAAAASGGGYPHRLALGAAFASKIV